ncbi:hypothetical protein [Streptomyces sp. H27-S2]|uniref:hypothetical protein n=1 Tax=Streptomyces antarcticus TaxID=2996458 RepID=UPI00226EB173|nr:hypothetical protein [Streptomyces sp. H27-S2]MCY0950055.1 hypothetical protein [Streptomyces sp. H27-S2]
MTPGHCSRAVRAAMFAALCVLLAATGHLLMSGAAVPWWAVSAAFAGTVATAWALAGRERGPAAVTAAAVAVQALLHALFSLAQSVVHPSLSSGTSFARQWAEYLTCGGGAAVDLTPDEALRVVTEAGLGRHVSLPPPGTVLTAVPESGTPVGHALHEAAGHASTAAADALPAGAHAMGGMSPAGMLAAHLLAAVLCGLWLAYGEQAAFRVLRALAGWLRAPLLLLFGRAATPHRPRVLVRRPRQGRAPRRLFLVHAITSRGPPTGTAVT